jgi:hypothetical protein
MTGGPLSLLAEFQLKGMIRSNRGVICDIYHTKMAKIALLLEKD